MVNGNAYARSMNPVQALLAQPVRHRALLYWGVSRLIRGGKRALLVDVRDALPYEFAREHGIEFIRINPLEARRSCGSWIELNRSRREVSLKNQICHGQIYLAGRDRDVRVRRSVYTGAGGCPTLDHILRMRTLDSEYLSLAQVGWLHLNDGEMLGDVLSGGRRFLQEHRPLVTIVPGAKVTGRTYVKELAALLRREGFSLWDALLRPVDSSWEDCGKGVTDMIAVPDERGEVVSTLRSIFFAGDPEEEMPDREELFLAADMVDKRLMQVSGEQRELLSEKLFGNVQSFPVSRLKKNNWYAAEEDENCSWCWSGPDRDARLLLPLSGPGRIHIDLEVYGVSEDAARGPVRLFAGGVLQKSSRVLQAGDTLSLDVVISRTGFQGFLPVLISVVGTQRPPEDPRQLGLALTRATIFWE